MNEPVQQINSSIKISSLNELQTLRIRFDKIKFPKSSNRGMVMDLFKGTILDFEVTNVTLMFPHFVTALI